MPASKKRRKEEEREKRGIIREAIEEERGQLLKAQGSFMIGQTTQLTNQPGCPIQRGGILNTIAWEAVNNLLPWEVTKRMEKALIAFRLPEGITKSDVVRVAQSRGTTITGLMHIGLGFSLGFDNEHLRQWHTLASRFNYPLPDFLQNIIDDWLSERRAEEEVFGFAQRKDIFAHSVSTEGKEKPITGDLFKEWRDAEHLKAKELELANNLIENFERTGMEVPEDLLWVLIKHKMGRTWLESPEYKKWQEEAKMASLSEWKRGIMGEAEKRATEMYELSRAQHPELAKQTIAEGKKILEEAIALIKEIKRKYPDIEKRYALNRSDTEELIKKFIEERSQT